MEKCILRLAFLLLITAGLYQGPLLAQASALSVKVARTATTGTWDKVPAIFLQGLDAMWSRTADRVYFKVMRRHLDAPGDKDGNPGFPLLTLYQVTGQPKYFEAATALWNQLQLQQADKNKKLYLAAPFAAAYGTQIHDRKVFDRITEQFISAEDQIQSPEYGMALVDALMFFPENHAGRKKLIPILHRVVAHIEKQQDSATGLSAGTDVAAASMHVYTIGKALRLGYLPSQKLAVAKHEYSGMIRSFINEGNNGQVVVKGKARRLNDPEDIGALLLAANEMELAALPKPGKGRVVLLDSWFNNEIKKDQSDSLVRWHYKWAEHADGGFSFWGGQFEAAGFQLRTLYNKPSASNLKDAAVYIIVDPDSKKENSRPNYIDAADVEEIRSWVKSGGVLVLMGNDTANVEHEHFNKLAAALGIPFYENSKGKVLNDRFEMGRIDVEPGNTIFKQTGPIFIKEFSSIDVSAGATPALKDRDGNVVVATCRYGSGVVLAVGDPWLYNEYVDGRRLPAEYDNFKAGADLIRWIASQAPRIKN